MAIVVLFAIMYRLRMQIITKEGHIAIFDTQLCNKEPGFPFFFFGINNGVGKNAHFCHVNTMISTDFKIVADIYQ